MKIGWFAPEIQAVEGFQKIIIKKKMFPFYLPVPQNQYL